MDADRMQRAMVLIARGETVNSNSMDPPMDAEERDTWVELAREMQEIAARGHIVDIPFEAPSLAGYEKGRTPGVNNIP